MELNFPILPCPFCGNGNLTIENDRGQTQVHCLGCGSSGPWGEDDETYAKELWNQRTLSARDAKATYDK